MSTATCPDCGLTDCCPEGWEHISPADLLPSVLIDADRRRREEAS